MNTLRTWLTFDVVTADDLTPEQREALVQAASEAVEQAVTQFAETHGLALPDPQVPVEWQTSETETL